jgi:hypothetical protein
MRSRLLLIVLLLVLATAAYAEGIADRLFDPARWELSLVQVVAPQTASGAAISYRLAEYGNFAGWLDGGLLVGQTPDPFIGASTNIPPLDTFLKSALNADMRWGAGYAFRDADMFYYTRLRVELSFLKP